MIFPVKNLSLTSNVGEKYCIDQPLFDDLGGIIYRTYQRVDKEGELKRKKPSDRILSLGE